MTLETLRPEGWPRPAGYADGIVATGRVLVTAGEIGWDPRSGRVVSERLTDQVRQALENIVVILRAGGAGPEHLVRLTWYITDRDAYVAERGSIGAAYREVIGRHFPAMAVIVVAGLIEPKAKVEIEATAVVPP